MTQSNDDRESYKEEKGEEQWQKNTSYVLVHVKMPFNELTDDEILDKDVLPQITTKIPRVRGISERKFVDRFESTGQPVILENSLDGFAAREWTPNFLKDKYGEVICHATLNLPEEGSVSWHKWRDHSQFMPLAEFVEQLDSFIRPSYMQQIPNAIFNNFKANFDFGKFSKKAEQSRAVNLYLGTKNTASSLHWDTLDNFLAQIYGSKRVLLFAPEQTPKIYTFPDSLRTSPVDPYKPDVANYPKFRKAQGMLGTIHAGDTLFIPKRWWHHLRSLKTSISVNCWYGRECSVNYFLKVASFGGWKHFMVPARDFILLGLMRRNFDSRLMADVPTGKFLYGLCEGFVLRRIKGWSR